MARAKSSHSQAPDAKYHWKADEGVSEGFRRIVFDELELTIWQLSENAAALDEAVHEARKSLKKIRSVMRLMRDILGPHYDKENAALGDAGRKLSPLRDAEALIEMFDQLDDRGLVSVRKGLAERKKELGRDFHRKRVRANVLKTLREVAARVKKWDLPQADVEIVSSGFAETIRRNRKARDVAIASSKPEDFHEWRKRAKDLRYHLALVGKAWPKVLDGYQEAAKDLEAKLGDDHNLAVLRTTILEQPDRFGKQEDIKAAMEIIDDRQQKLRAEAQSLAEPLYHEKPKQWRKRLEFCWSVWHD